MPPFTVSRVLVLMDDGSSLRVYFLFFSPPSQSSSSFLPMINGALQPPQTSGRYGCLTLFRRTLSFNKVQCESEPIQSLKWNPPGVTTASWVQQKGEMDTRKKRKEKTINLYLLDKGITVWCVDVWIGAVCVDVVVSVMCML